MYVLSAPLAAFSDDYSSLIGGLLDLYDVTCDEALLEWAESLQVEYQN